MGREIERRFLVRDPSWLALSAYRIWHIRQKTLVRDPNGSISRIRLRYDVRAGYSPEAINTHKGATSADGLEQPEFNWPVPFHEGEEAFNTFPGEGIEKYRHVIPTGHWQQGTLGESTELTWEIDVFYGLNDGLLIAEMEFTDRTQASVLGTPEFPLPSWIGKEVTHDPRYKNTNLELKPYKTWGKD